MLSPPAGLRLLLASTSPWRLAICAQVGLDVDAVSPLVDEATILDDDPVALASARARAKADSVAAPDCVVIASDQVIHLGSTLFGKPADAGAHLAQLQALRGRTHVLTDGVSVVTPTARRDFVVQARVTLRADLTDEELSEYVATEDGRNCAGGYRAEGPGAWLIDKVEGDWFTVVGLPVYQVLDALRSLGWRRRADWHIKRPPPHGSPA
ncbi:MAG: septum formation protein Maf [Myxococcales bacterium]|nr:septum formation protein Maf [Myxococcales bacterium]